jgi:hypothetical protein
MAAGHDVPRARCQGTGDGQPTLLAVAQWRRGFTPELADAFLEHFPRALQLLGDETSDAWVLRLPQPAIRGVFADLRNLALHHLEAFAGLTRSASKS